MGGFVGELLLFYFILSRLVFFYIYILARGGRGVVVCRLLFFFLFVEVDVFFFQLFQPTPPAASTACSTQPFFCYRASEST